RNRLVLAFIDDFSGGIDKAIKKIVELRKDGTIGEWAATAAYSINNLSAIALTEFARIARFGPAAFDTIKIAGKLLWQPWALLAKGEMTAVGASVTSFKTTTSAAFAALRGNVETGWNLISGSGKLAWAGLKSAALLAFIGIGTAAQKSINAIIAGFNKIPGVKIDPVQIENLSAAKTELKVAFAEMKTEAAKLVPGGAAWQPMIAGAKEALGIAKSGANEIADAFRSMAQKTSDALDENEKLRAAYMDAEKLTEAILGFESDTLKIQNRRLAVEEKIAQWQTAARDAENRKTTATEETLGALAEQSEELKKASSIGQQLRGIFGVPLAMIRAGQKRIHEPRTAMAERERTDAGRGDKVEREQLKVQQAMAASMKSLVAKPGLVW
ncbi:MAG: hypothetical protein WCY59_06940, partial [Anaerovoracaceae bacterium]